ncbi:MAG: aminoacyl-histidine dipeptidase [Bacteroidetes bacterium]|nr:aminoacyl-histidine dipeptidase [Bacteroidota bacterium]
MDILKGLKPEKVWSYFEEICQIPRPSKKEEKIIEYLVAFGKKHNLKTKKDKVGNVIIKKPATKGKENLKGIVLQSHIDMVCEKNNDVEHDFDKDPIIPFIDGGWVKAKGTTLGADDGIGVAAELAILAANDIEHGPIECLFTVDEETGLTGAFALKKGFIEDGEILLNLDSEDEGEIFIGCAGGIDTTATFLFKNRSVPSKSTAFKVEIKGLKGGHSGDEINKGLGNSNKILNRFLWNATNDFKIRLSDFNGGNLRNAIAREANALVVVPNKHIDDFKEYFTKFSADVKNELSITEPNLAFSIEETYLPKNVIDKDDQHKLLNALYACPHGVSAMSQEMPGMVETSTNLAAVKFIDGKKIFVTTSQRSSIDSSIKDIAAMVESVFRLADAKFEHSDGYPGWKPNPDSEILKVSEKSYQKLFNVKPVVRAIHAGLECGLFLEKYPNMDMVSFGPTLRAVHSPDEKIDIETVQKFWDLLLDILKNVPAK